MRKQNSSTAGFTIVELLIVIVVIAILATISIVAYRGIQERARASEATSGLAQAKKKLELYKVDNSTYPTSGNLASAGVSDTDVSYQYTSDGSTYCLTATAGTTSYTATNTTTPTQGGCAGHGQGGMAAVTNLIKNPSFESGTSGWAARGTGVTIGSTSTSSRSGSSSVVIQMPSSVTQNDWGASMIPADRIEVVPGETLAFSAYFKTTAGASAFISIYWRNSGGSPIGAPQIGSIASSSSWVRSTLTATAPATAAGVDVYLASNTSNALYYADDAMVTRGSALTAYADGNSPNWIWNGASNNSSSTGPSL